MQHAFWEQAASRWKWSRGDEEGSNRKSDAWTVRPEERMENAGSRWRLMHGNGCGEVQEVRGFEHEARWGSYRALLPSQGRRCSVDEEW